MSNIRICKCVSDIETSKLQLLLNEMISGHWSRCQKEIDKNIRHRICVKITDADTILIRIFFLGSLWSLCYKIRLYIKRTFKIKLLKCNEHLLFLSYSSAMSSKCQCHIIIEMIVHAVNYRSQLIT